MSNPACSRPAATMPNTHARMLVAWILLRAASLTPRCSALCLQQMCNAKVKCSSSGNVTESGEVSDSACSRPAATILDACARMLVARSLSRDAGLTPLGSVLCHTQQIRVAKSQRSASGHETERGEVSNSACSWPAAAMFSARVHVRTAHAL